MEIKLLFKIIKIIIPKKIAGEAVSLLVIPFYRAICGPFLHIKGDCLVKEIHKVPKRKFSALYGPYKRDAYEINLIYNYML